MMLWEEMHEGKPFALQSVSDVVKYAYTCYACYTASPMAFDTFADAITPDDIDALTSQMQTASEQKKTT